MSPVGENPKFSDGSALANFGLVFHFTEFIVVRRFLECSVNH